MKNEIDNIQLTCNNNLTAVCKSKSTINVWTFTLTSCKSLHAVALLYDTHRTYFEIDKIVSQGLEDNVTFEISNKQECLFDQNNNVGAAEAEITYIITIKFRTNIYGTFRQCVIFDVGLESVLCRNLCVDVVPVERSDEIAKIAAEIALISKDCWTDTNHDIIPFTTIDVSYNDCSSIEERWKKLYPCPKSEFVLTSDIFSGVLSRNNYRLRMHSLLYMEEMARNEQINKFNVEARLHVVNSYILATPTPNSIAKYANFGELYAYINLTQELSEDTPCGRLLLNNCSTVLLKVEDPKVYEVVIEDKGKSMLYLRLSAITVTELDLKPGRTFKAQLQFQLNRQSYCEWHQAIDNLPDVKMVFPDNYLDPLIPWSPDKQWNDEIDTRLNLKQKEALIAITTPTFISLPPILLMGPFGTGKTFTFAQTAKELLKQEGTKILICTHTNSAADIYIKDYFHEYFKSGNLEARPLRIYYQKRWVYSAHPIVQEYCLIKESQNTRTFVAPTLEDLDKHRIIVVTLSTSSYLCNLGLPAGYFTHILLDEAAQTLECEAIMPLYLATPNTRIVLAGDHMQLSPELHSVFAKSNNMHVSLLERLYDYYPETFPCKILLLENYRAHAAIVDFTSEMFYEQKLVACGRQLPHPNWYPLTFFTVRGEDVQDINSGAFYNRSEAYEIVERVSELKNNWPETWGTFNEQSIGIITPYSDQVFLIRSELRKRCLGQISVERVLNVQGKQFRAIFLSVVRTSKTYKEFKNNKDYGFLSDQKLLNAAITRAQSLVAVVGDPVALCSLSRCRTIWEKFITTGDENNSLFGITMDDLRRQLNEIDLTQFYGLNPMATEFQPRIVADIQGPVLHEKTVYACWPMYNLTYRPLYVTPRPQPTYTVYVAPAPSTAKPPNAPPLPVALMPPQSLAERPCAPPPNTQLFHIPSHILPHTAPLPAYTLVPQSLPHPALHPSVTPQPLPQPGVWAHRVPLGALSPSALSPSTPPQSRTPPKPIQKPINNDPECASSNPQVNGTTASNTTPECDLIQFLDKVHIPNHIMNNGHSIHDLMNLLPKNMSLAHVLTQPASFLIQWYNNLLVNKGIDAAKRFEYLISVTTNKPKRGIDLPASQDSDNVLLSVNRPYLDEQLPNLYKHDDPINQINFDKPVYHLPNIRGHEQTESGYHGRESAPLYQRQPFLKEEEEGYCYYDYSKDVVIDK